MGACLATTVPANHSGASTALPWTGKHIKTKMQLGTPDVKCDQRRGFGFPFNLDLRRETEEYIATPPPPTTPPVSSFPQSTFAWETERAIDCSWAKTFRFKVLKLTYSDWRRVGQERLQANVCFMNVHVGFQLIGLSWEVNALGRAIVNLTNGVQGMREENGALRKEVGALREENGALSEEVGALRKENGALSEEVGALRKEVGALSEEVGALRKEVGALREENGALREEVGALREENGALSEEVGALRKEVGALSEEVGALRKEVGALREEVGALRKEVGALREENGALRKEVGALDKKLDKVLEKLEKLEKHEYYAALVILAILLYKLRNAPVQPTTLRYTLRTPPTRNRCQLIGCGDTTWKHIVQLGRKDKQNRRRELEAGEIPPFPPLDDSHSLDGHM